MKRLLLTTLIAAGVTAGAMLYSPTPARADHDWDVRYNAYRQRWDNHRHWRNHYYQPYYQRYYHSQPYYSGYPQTYYYRPNYGTYYYGSPYGYRDYRYGGAVRVGPLQFYWR